MIGGDWSIPTFDCQSSMAALADFVSRMLLVPERARGTHQLHPERRLERPIFEDLRSAGFECDSCNVVGAPTWHFDLIAELRHAGARVFDHDPIAVDLLHPPISPA